jgi:hypothetical protein
MRDIHGVHRGFAVVALTHGVVVMARRVLVGAWMAWRPVKWLRLSDVDQHGRSRRRLGEDELDAAGVCGSVLGAGSLELPPRAVGHSVEAGIHGAAACLPPGDVADVARPERRDSRGGGRRLRDGYAAEDRLDGRLAKLPVPGPEQADRAVHRVEHAAASLVQQRPEYCCTYINGDHQITAWRLGAHTGAGSSARNVYTDLLDRCIYICTYTDTHTGSDVFGAGGDEVDEACAAVELGEEDGGVALRVGAADPLQARPDGAVVAAPLAKHAAPVAAHPHPGSFVDL